MPDNRPNILLILTDQLRYDALGCYGGQGVSTPNLDRLAAQGTRFTHCYVNNPICTPSRASLWTGKHLTGHGVHRLHDCLPPDEVMFSTRLSDVGYDTALFGKLHVSGFDHEKDHRHPNDGFRIYEWTMDPRGTVGGESAYWKWLEGRAPDVLARLRKHGGKAGHIPVEAHMTTWAAERTISFLENEREQGKPFFCCMSVFDPHDPYENYPKEMESLVDKNQLAPIMASEEDFTDRPSAHQQEREQCYLARIDELTPEEIERIRFGYHAAVALIDQQVGRVLDALEKAGLGNDTIVVFTSDHGDMLGDHGLLVKGAFFYDPCTRVPLIMRSPGMPPSVREELCQPHDLPAFLLSAAGYDQASISKWMPEAVSLADQDALRMRGYAVCMYRNTGIFIDRQTGIKNYSDPPINATMWRQGRYKLNVYHGSADESDEGELYDMQSDPNELRNLWHDADMRGVRDQLMQRLQDWLKEQDANARPQGRDAMPTDPAYQNIGRMR
jgi:arylsulfatase